MKRAVEKKHPALPGLVERADAAHRLAWDLVAASDRFVEAMRELTTGNVRDAHWYLHWGGFVPAPKKRHTYPGSSARALEAKHRPKKRRRKRAG